MDVSQIASLSTGLSAMQTNNDVGTIMLKKTLDNNASTVSQILQGMSQLPANPAIGRNINTTA